MFKRRYATLFALLLIATFSFASHKEKKKDAPLLRQVGFTFREFAAPEDYNWRGSDARTLSTIIWYPAEAAADEKDQYIGDPPLFYAGRAAKDATSDRLLSRFLSSLSRTAPEAAPCKWHGSELISPRGGTLS